VKDFGVARRLAALARSSFLAAPCSGRPQPGRADGGTATSSPTQAAKQYVIGFSNTAARQRFREEQNCTAKAEALASASLEGSLMIAHNTDSAGQLADLRDLISQGVDCDRVQPSSADALTRRWLLAKAAGIKTVAVDAYVTDPELELLQQPGRLRVPGRSWLFKYLVEDKARQRHHWYTRGHAGHRPTPIAIRAS